MSNNKVRIAVLVSGGGTNLQALLDAEKSGKLPSGEIAAVISNKCGAYALTRAEAAGKGATALMKKDFACDADFEAALAQAIADCGAELIVLAGFTHVLSKAFVTKYPRRIINIHPSLIPSFCGRGFYGLRVHEAALRYGVKVTGATVHFVNEVTDGGEIILQKAVEVKEGDTAKDLQRRVMEEAEWILLPQAVEAVCREIASAREQ